MSLVRIVIVGGGIGGLAAALALRRAGFAPAVYERAPALHEVGAAIAVWPNAFGVLERLGLAEAVLGRAGLINHARWLGRDGRPYNRFEFPETRRPAVALRRADLQGALLSALPPESVQLGETFVGFEARGEETYARFDGGAEVACDVLIGADGLHSRVRAQLLGDGEPVYRGYNVWRGVARLEHASLEPHTASEVYGEGRRFGIGPVGLGRTGWWATANGPEATQESASEHGPKLSRMFDGWCAPVRELIEATPSETILRNAAYDRPASARWGEGRVTLLGDAIHPMTPNLGQGGCVAIEDAAVLARCLAKYADARAALRAYESARRTRAARVASYSRRYGVFGQWQSPAATRLRARLLSYVPESAGRRLLSLIFDYDAYGVEI
ncbi:MAG TPA: FAD-dependent monooxygenase [Pyrinomonadaceae bacterium]|nr:FAD-dependent monooxygenase [Pyrinomonadaceae bacterium]